MSDKLKTEISDKQIGKNVRKSREARGLTLTQLAEIIGVTHPAISNVENGKSFSKQILIALGSTLDDDFGVTWLQEHQAKFKNKKTVSEEENSIDTLITKKIVEILNERLAGLKETVKEYVQDEVKEFEVRISKKNFIQHEGKVNTETQPHEIDFVSKK